MLGYHCRHESSIQLFTPFEDPSRWTIIRFSLPTPFSTAELRRTAVATVTPTTDALSRVNPANFLPPPSGGREKLAEIAHPPMPEKSYINSPRIATHISSRRFPFSSPLSNSPSPWPPPPSSPAASSSSSPSPPPPPTTAPTAAPVATTTDPPGHTTTPTQSTTTMPAQTSTPTRTATGRTSRDPTRSCFLTVDCR